jgi:putative transposase
MLVYIRSVINIERDNTFPNRHYPRLHDYDYSREGAYFITICTHGRQSLFGTIPDGLMQPSLYGKIVADSWQELPLHYPAIANDVFVVMPNHFHGIIIIDDCGRSGSKPDPTCKFPLSEIVRGFKTFSARKINELRNSQGNPVWQRSYYEHIIRSEMELEQIGAYILFNPSKWEFDRENPKNFQG